MGGALGIFLNFYLFPMLGLGLLGLGSWSTWKLWTGRGGGAAGPSLAARVAALILGAVWGWCLVNLTHPLDGQRAILGFPMPVMTLSAASGRWLELGGAASLPCLLLDLAIGLGMVHTALHLAWKLRPRRRPRRRAGFIDSWRAPRAEPRARRIQAPFAAGARVPVQGRAGRRGLTESGLEEPLALPVRHPSSRS